MTPTRFIKIKALVLGAALVGAGVAHAEPGPRVYIPTGDSAEVLIIDANTNGVIGEIAGFSAAHGLAVTIACVNYHKAATSIKRERNPKRNAEQRRLWWQVYNQTVSKR